MSKYDNAGLVAGVTPLESGAVYIDPQTTDLANAPFITAAVVTADVFQIGVVPANCVLVPQLSKLTFPIIDATATVAIGTTADGDALLAAAAITAATTKFGHQLLQAKIGSPDEDTPLYATIAGTVGGFATTGKIVAELALRPWRQEVDG